MELLCYKTMPEWSAQTLPKGFQRRHNTKAGTWAKLEIRRGQLRYDALDDQGAVIHSELFDAGMQVPLIQPQAWHRVEPASEDLRVQLSFYCQPEDYFHKKYGLTRTHSNVAEMLEFLQSGHALDIGCGRGRNAVFLQKRGFTVDAFDPKPAAIDRLKEIIAAEGLEGISAFVAEAQSVVLEQTYDLIINTVVLMFIEAAQIPKILRTMQDATRPGGYNLIVCAMDTQAHPYDRHALPFRFGFKERELLDSYNGWDIARYDESVGHLHRLDEDGNPIPLHFATLIARKHSRGF